MTIITSNTGRVIGASSWSTGFVALSLPCAMDLLAEARKNWEAVINRLHRLGEDDMAEWIFDRIT